MPKVKKHSLKFTCSNCTYQPEQFSDPRKQGSTSELALMESQQSFLPAVLMQAPEMRRSSIGLRKSGFGCSLDALVPSSSPIWTPPITPRFLIFWPKFNMSWISSFLLRLWLLHRWLCRWHLNPNSEMQLWLQHLCLHMLASNVELLFMPYDFSLGS